jgi:hypothetical protein
MGSRVPTAGEDTGAVTGIRPGHVPTQDFALAVQVMRAERGADPKESERPRADNCPMALGQVFIARCARDRSSNLRSAALF